jgi:medium-chain acyl-[acyl-carrier-protein] hydrolase
MTLAVRAAVPQPAAVVRLVCFAHAGGSPSMFNRWPAGLAPDVEVWPVTLPGRGGRARESAVRDWAPLVDELAIAVAEQVPGPVALFGHSLGGLLAFEVGRALARTGEPPVHLLVSARAAPERRHLVELPATDEALLAHVGRLYDGVPDVVRDSPELRAHFVPILRRDLQLVNSYRFHPGPPLPCPITVFGGETDRTVGHAELAGWSDHTSVDCEVHQFPGGHFYLDGAEPAVLQAVWRRLCGRRPTIPAQTRRSEP